MSWRDPMAVFQNNAWQWSRESVDHEDIDEQATSIKQYHHHFFISFTLILLQITINTYKDKFCNVVKKGLFFIIEIFFHIRLRCIHNHDRWLNICMTRIARALQSYTVVTIKACLIPNYMELEFIHSSLE